MSEYPKNDPCEKCRVMDGMIVVAGQFLCYRCSKKVKKQIRKGGNNGN
jgi:hypothetical protein